jgi:hypothetical protein
MIFKLIIEFLIICITTTCLILAFCDYNGKISLIQLQNYIKIKLK